MKFKRIEKYTGFVSIRVLIQWHHGYIQYHKVLLDIEIRDVRERNGKIELQVVPRPYGTEENAMWVEESKVGLSEHKWFGGWFCDIHKELNKRKLSRKEYVDIVDINE